MAEWKGSILSSAGKFLLIKSMLQNLPIYIMSLYKIPSTYRERIERIQKNFLWQGMEEKFKYHLVSSDKVCTPKSIGGLGIKDIKKMNEALIVKMGWRMISEKKP